MLTQLSCELVLFFVISSTGGLSSPMNHAMSTSDCLFWLNKPGLPFMSGFMLGMFGIIVMHCLIDVHGCCIMWAHMPYRIAKNGGITTSVDNLA